MSRRRRTARRDERGAVIVVVAISIVVILIAAAFAVDIGSEVQTNRSLQAKVDAAAMDGAAVLTGLPGSNPALQDAVAVVVAQSLGRNSYSCHSVTVNGTAVTSLDGVTLCPSSDQKNTVTVSVGGWQGPSTVDQSASSADAVQVQLYGLTSFAFGGIAGKASQVSNRTAAALNSNLACSGSTCNPPTCSVVSGSLNCTTPFTPISGISIGSSLVNINTQQSVLLNSLLGGLLGTSVNLGVLTYQGLATLNLSMLDLVNAAATVLGPGSGVTNVQQLMTASLPVGQLLEIVLQAITTADPALGAAISASVSLTRLASLTATTQLCQAVQIQGGAQCPTSSQIPTDAAEAQISALGLFQALIELGGAKYALVINTGLNPGPISVGLATVTPTVKLSVDAVQPVQVAPPGPVGTSVSTAQLVLNVDVSLDVSALGLLDNSVQLAMNGITAAAATGTLSAITCPSAPSASGSSTSVTVNTSALNFGTAASPDITLSAPSGLLGTLGKMTMYGSLAGTGFTPDPMHFSYPFSDTNTQSGGTTSLALTLQSSGGSGLLGALGSLLSASALSPVETLLSQSYLGGSLLSPLLSALGVQLAGATVTDYYIACGPAVSVVQ